MVFDLALLVRLFGQAILLNRLVRELVRELVGELVRDFIGELVRELMEELGRELVPDSYLSYKLSYQLS